MTIREIIKFSIKIIIVIYLCAVFAFIVFSVTPESKNSILDSFSPINLFNEIISGNWLFIYLLIFLTIFVLGFNYYRRTRVDYEDGGAPPRF